ncbi:FAD/NAD(P)-binding protein [Psychroserpens mesophilus]|uniref:FAD/NAD(P)-binding protein n=1 Tax=Psychroserpens mesophilus TaxID=325473 RepID=UPI003D65DBDA
MNTLAIIGIGPRGLFALEKLLQNLSVFNKKLNIIGFEPIDNIGAGDVWMTNQDASNWANISERALQDLKGRPEIIYNKDVIQPFPAYSDWANTYQPDSNPDIFPLRSKIGKYLNERYNSLEIQNLYSITFKLIQEKVLAVKPVKNKLQVFTDNENYYDVDDVLITIGHQPTKLSTQMKSWKKHASMHENLQVYENSYPLSQFEHLDNETDIVIGIRGFGLSMVDVMRGLTTSTFGRFKITNSETFKTVFIDNPDKKILLVPFSLDGKPLAPKPLNNIIDQLFKPTAKDLISLKTQIESVARTNSEASNINFLIEPVANISTKIFSNSNLNTKSHALHKNQLQELILKWFENEDIDHKLIANKKTYSTYALIKKYIDMALYKDKISLDYCLGQVWRHCQPTLYQSLSHSKLKKDLLKKIIDLDERIKRYSYGPPIESMQQMVALIESKVLNLDYINDPKIELSDKGWNLINSKNNSIKTTLMIDSVLDAPKLLKVDSALIKQLLNDDLIQPIHSELGIETDSNGIVQSACVTYNSKISLLGRLSKGSIIGADSILECFGKQVEDWAKNYIKNLT